jgi:hypothetical protein
MDRVYVPLDELDRRVELMGRYYGQMIGVAYGEAFFVKEMMQVDDVVEMPVRSL